MPLKTSYYHPSTAVPGLTSSSSSETTMIEALDKTHCYTLQKQNQKKKRFGKHNPVSNRKLSPTSFDQVPQNSQRSFSRQCTPETHIPHLKKLSLSKLQLSFCRQWTPETHIPHLKKDSLAKLQPSFSQQWTPETHIPHLKKLSFSKLQLSFSLDNGPQKLTFPTSKNSLSLKTPNFLSLDNAPRNYSHSPPRKIRSLSLSLKSQLSFSRQCTPDSLSLSLSKVPTFFLSTMHPRNSHPPPQKTLSLCLSKSERASGSAHPFVPRTHSLGRRRAGPHL